jgi:glycosyltransferase involved in cell wall biosynthesis
MSLVYLPQLKSRPLETLSHTLLALLHSLGKGFDRIFVFNCANSPLLAVPLLFGKKAALHVDGLEWKRGKWSRLGQAYYRYSERLASRLPVVLICDSKAIRHYYRERYGRETRYIPYGAQIHYSRDGSLIGMFGLEPGGYFLQITRFEPENNPLLTVRAFKGLRTGKKLVLVGGVKYQTAYSQAVFKEVCSSRPNFGEGTHPQQGAAAENVGELGQGGKTQKNLGVPECVLNAKTSGGILLPGLIYDQDLRRELLTNAFAYIHGNEVGGTNPALLEAMAAGGFVISRDVPYNREVLQDAGIYFEKDAEDLRRKMEWALAREGELAAFREKARTIIREKYDWESVTDAYESLFLEMGAKK